MIIETKFGVGDKIKRTKYPFATASFGSAKPVVEHLQIIETRITAGSPWNGNQKSIVHTCFNRDTGKFVEIDERDMKNAERDFGEIEEMER